MTTLVDYAGRPVDVSSLRGEQAAPHTQSIRSPWDDMVAHGMTPVQVVRFLKAASMGDHDTYVKFAADMERRDPHYYSVLQTRKLAVVQLPRKVEAPTDDPAEVKIAETLTSLVNSDGFTSILMNVLDALGKGFSVNEILWDTTGSNGRLWRPKAIKWRNPKFFKLHPDTADVWLLRDNSTPDGKPLAPYKFIVHEPNLASGLPVAGGLARVCLAMHMFKSFGIRSWMAFAEIYGMPLRIGKYPKSDNPQDVETLRKALRDLGADAAAVLPNGMDIQIERAAQSGMPGGDSFFEVLSRFMNAEMSKAVLGQTMTTDDGSSLAQATIHNEVRKDLRDADAEMLQDTLNRDLIRPFVDLNFGPRQNPEDYPRLVLDVEEPEDLVSLAEALTPFIDRGLRVEQSVIRDKFQLPEPAPDAEVLAPPTKETPGATDKPKPDTNATPDLMGAALVTEIVRLAERHTNHRDFMIDLKDVLNRATRK